MKLTILISFLIFQLNTNAQFGSDSAKSKSNFIYDSLDSDFFKSMKTLVPISESKNYIEIRVFIFHSFGESEGRILAYDKEGWHAMRITAPGLLWQQKPFFVKQQKLIPKKNITEIISQLDSIDLRHLKSIEEINKTYFIDDGVKYFVSYKNGTEFGHITFNNPLQFLAEFPKQDEYKKYVNIVTIFLDQFIKE